MLKRLFSKLKLKRIIEIFIGISFLFIPLFWNLFTTPVNFNFLQNNSEEIITLPEEKDFIINSLKNAQKSIDITIYLLSDRKIIEKLKQLKNNDININIIIEKNPFGGGSNYKTFNELKNAGINIKYANSKFALTHAKYIIIDKKEALIMTSNMTYAGLNENRDFIFHTFDENIVKELIGIFESDFNNKKYKSNLDNLVVSPDNSRNKIESIIKSAKNNIYIYVENIQDESFIDLIIKKAKKGINIKIIAPDNKKIETNIPIIEKLKENSIQVYNLKKPYQHSKIIIIDESLMYLGSINFSSQSMDRNREIGVISLNNNSINEVLRTFEKDIKR